MVLSRRHGRVVTDSFLMLVKVGFQTLKADDEVVTLSHRIGAEVKGTIAEYKGEGDPAAQHSGDRDIPVGSARDRLSAPPLGLQQLLYVPDRPGLGLSRAGGLPAP